MSLWTSIRWDLLTIGLGLALLAQPFYEYVSSFYVDRFLFRPFKLQSLRMEQNDYTFTLALHNFEPGLNDGDVTYLRLASNVRHLTVLTAPNRSAMVSSLAVGAMPGLSLVSAYPSVASRGLLQVVDKTVTEFVSNQLLSKGHAFSTVFIVSPHLCNQQNQGLLHNQTVYRTTNKLYTTINHELLNSLKQVGEIGQTELLVSSIYLSADYKKDSVLDDVLAVVKASIQRSLQLINQLLRGFLTSLPKPLGASLEQTLGLPRTPRPMVEVPWWRLFRIVVHAYLGAPLPSFSQEDRPSATSAQWPNCTLAVRNLMENNGWLVRSVVDEALRDRSARGFVIRALLQNKKPFLFKSNK